MKKEKDPIIRLFHAFQRSQCNVQSLADNAPVHVLEKGVYIRTSFWTLICIVGVFIDIHDQKGYAVQQAVHVVRVEAVVYELSFSQVADKYCPSSMGDATGS